MFTGISSEELTRAAVMARQKLGTAASIRFEAVVSAGDGIATMELVWEVLVRRNKKPFAIGQGQSPEIAIAQARKFLEAEAR